MTTENYRQEKILGVKIDFLSREAVLNRVGDYIAEQNRRFREEGTVNSALLSTTNPEFIMTAQKDPEFKEVINSAFLSVPDGIGVLYADYYLNSLLKDDLKPDFQNFERVTGVQLVYDLCEMAAEKDFSVFLLGGWPQDFWGRGLEDPGFDIAQLAGQKLQERFPDLNLVGATSQFSYKKEDDEATVSYIQDSMHEKGEEKVDILIVCYGHGHQEKWIDRNSAKIPAVLSMGAGGSFDYVSENVSWAPEWIRKSHLEWLYRLLTQPWRIKRLVMSFPIFPLKVILSSFK